MEVDILFNSHVFQEKELTTDFVADGLTDCMFVNYCPPLIHHHYHHHSRIKYFLVTEPPDCWSAVELFHVPKARALRAKLHILVTI